MKLSRIFESLTHGELSQVKIGGGERGEIHDDDYRKVCNHISLGLTDLFSRFNLKQGQLVVQLFPGQYLYPLLAKYAVSATSSAEAKRWVLDTTAMPFREDILKILTIETDSGTPFILNDYTNDLSIVTPSMNSIRVPAGIANLAMALPMEYKTSKLVVNYQANHAAFLPRMGVIDPNRVEIELPESHLQALLYFVASRAHNPVGMGQEFNAGNTWFMKYAQECQRLEFAGFDIDDSTNNTRSRRNGWV